MTRDFDVIVLGLGGIGSGAAYWLAKRGAKVLGLEQFELDHNRGESHDHSRIIRLSYVSPPYVNSRKKRTRRGRRSRRTRTSSSFLAPAVSTSAPRRRDSALRLRRCAARVRRPVRTLDAEEIQRRWPAFTIGDEIHGLYQADGGIVAAERATAAHHRAARALGAPLRDDAPVTQRLQATANRRTRSRRPTLSRAEARHRRRSVERSRAQAVRR